MLVKEGSHVHRIQLDPAVTSALALLLQVHMVGVVEHVAMEVEALDIALAATRGGK